ncbi:MAG: threonine/serine dehydratase [Caulobacterales bacterium]|nr:threonine/serine dehydratase [Caulobacterales bacterium]
MTVLIERIRKADVAIRPQVRVTPLEESRALSATLGCEVWLKCDHLQPTGSFKIRGATNRVHCLTDAERRAGVTTASTGNHGQAVARAGALAGVPVTVYVAASATPAKQAAIRALGAELVVVEGSVVEAELTARRVAGETGRVYISPYNDVEVVAGQGTLGLELMDQAPDLDAVFIATGCGGLTGGAGTAIKSVHPQTRVVAVWPERSPALLRSLEAGRVVDCEDLPTLSDGTAGAVEPGSITFPICQEVIDETVTVTEPEIAAAMRRIAEAERWMVEGAAGVALGGLIKTADQWRGRKVAVVLCGRNIALDAFLDAVGG